MPRPKPLTDTLLRSLKPTGSRYEVPDGGISGLVVRVSTTGARSWALSYRVRGDGLLGGKRVTRLAGEKRRLTLGNYPTISLAEARARAAEAKRLAHRGIDPDMVKQTAPVSREVTVDDLIESYVRDHLCRNGLRAGPNGERQLRLHISPAWGSKPLASIKRGDLVRLLEKVRIPFEIVVRDGDRVERRTRGGPGAAAELRKWVRAMFGFAVDTGLRPDNPFVDVRNRDRQHARDRVLSMTELAAIWRAARQVAYPWGPFIQLILLTGDRRAEWARARWDWFNDDWSLLTIPAAFYKTGKDQVAPISDAARAILDLLPTEITGPHIFSTDGGATPISGFSKAKARLDALLAEQCGNPMTPWVIHDLRRSMATHMERIGIEPHVIEMCLGHVLKGVAGTYRRYGYLPERTVALQAWADELARACAGSASCQGAADAPHQDKSERRCRENA